MAEEIVRYEDRDGAQITLTPQDVAAYCYSGTAQLTQRDVVNFMATCKALGANPYLKDVYLVKYGGSEDAQIMAGKNYYTRVAASIETYDGMTAGVVCVTQQGTVEHRVGSMAHPGDTCVGGWAEVHDRRWSVPVRVEVSMDEYNSRRSLWKSKPLTMIRKVALVQALREAYPDRFAGTYDQSEMPDARQPRQVAASVQPAKPARPQRPTEEETARMAEVVDRAEADGMDREEARRRVWGLYQAGGMQSVEGWVASGGDVTAEADPDTGEVASPAEPDLYETDQEF